MSRVNATVLLVVLFGVGLWKPANAQSPPPVTLSASEMHEFRATNGTAYQLYVAFPIGYEPGGDAEYPVLYVTDAFAAFGLVAQTVRLMELGGELPPMIVVGIDNPVGSYAEWTARRVLPLSPTRFPRREQEISQQVGLEVRSGGADAFLATITNEIVPWVESRYVVSEERGLVGGSLGGLFATHVLLTSPDSFTHYLIGSPALYWDNEVMFDREEAYASEHDDLEARVFLYVGADEDPRGMMVSHMLRLSGSLESRTYPGLILGRRIFNDETHLSVPGGAISRGLVFLFGSR